MKLLKLSLFLALSFLIQFSASAQKIKIKKGDFTALATATKMKVVFHYDNMNVGKKTEKNYVEEKIKEKNKKEEGSGERWHSKWIADREKDFEPKFMALVKKGLMETNLKVSESYEDAPYVLHVYTTDTEPGFNVGVMRRPSYISLDLKLVEAGSDNELAWMELINARGADAMGFDYDVTKRVMESYAKAGKEFAKYLVKNELKIAKSSSSKKKKKG